MSGIPHGLERVSEVDIGPAVDILLNKNIFSYSYQVLDGVHMVGFKRKLF
jgi:hypothetical protein